MVHFEQENEFQIFCIRIERASKSPLLIPCSPSNGLGTSDRIVQGRFLRLIPQYIEQAWFEGTSDPNSGHLFYVVSG